MHSGVLIDDQGRAWPDNSWELAQRVRFRGAPSDLASFAVRELGFVHLRNQDGAVRVLLREGRFSLVTFTGLMLELRRMRSERIVLSVQGGSFPGFRLFVDMHDFCSEVEPLAAGKPLEIRLPRLAEKRNPKVLQLPAFAQVRPVVELWKATRGHLIMHDVRRAVSANGLDSRMILVRQVASSRLIVEHLGTGIQILRPTESVSMTGREFGEHPDHDYGCWVARAYAETSQEQQIAVESVRALVRTSSAGKLRTRYDRVLIPWSSRGTVFVLGISVQREVPAEL